MIVLDTPAGRFAYRVAGIALHGHHILLQRVKHDNFWFLPGGRAEMGETSQETLLRELREELDTDAQIERLVWVVENFFTLNGKPRHEIGFYYLITLPPDFVARSMASPPVFQDQGTTLICQWLPLGEVSRLNMYPTCLTRRLTRLPQQVEHIIHHDT